MDTQDQIPPQRPPSSPAADDQSAQTSPTRSGEGVILEYERQLAVLHGEVEALERSRSILAEAVEKESSAIKELEKSLTPILDTERGVLAALREVSQKEHGAHDFNVLREHEGERWKRIEEWYAVEQKKWGIEEELDAQKKAFEHDKHTHAELAEKEALLGEKIKSIEIEEEKEKFHLILSKIQASRIDTEGKLASLKEANEKAIAQFGVIRQSEGEIEKKEEGVEGLLSVAKSLAEERTLSEERYALEKKRHEIESSRWNIEDEIARLGGATVDLEKQLNEMRKNEADVLQKLTHLESGGIATALEA